MTCDECESKILNFEKLNNVHESRFAIIECLHVCFRQKFIKWAEIYYSNPSYDLVSDSFSDGIDALADYAWKNGVAPEAKLETIVFGFCKRHLLKNLISIKDKPEIELPEDFEEVVENDDRNREAYFECLNSSIKLLDNNELEIIMWKHYLKLSNDEITRRFNIKIEENKKNAEQVKNEIDNYIDKELTGYNEESVNHLKEEIAGCLTKKIAADAAISTHAATQRLFKAMERLRALASNCIKKEGAK